MEEKKIEELLKQSGEQENIPESLKSENMQKFLEQNAGKNKKKKNSYKWCSMVATAACVGLLVFAGQDIWKIADGTKQENEKVTQKCENTESKTEESETEENKTEESILLVENYDTSYDELYDYFKKQEQENRVYSSAKGEEKETAMEEAQTEDSESAFGADGTQGGESTQDYADTNKQETGVDEADIIKNDGRYLYQIIEDENDSKVLQIVDTQGGLNELTRIEGIDNPIEFYVWNDTLVIMESCWADRKTDGENTMAYNKNDMAYSDDIAYSGTAFQKIHVYDITDRTKPKEQHLFTAKGNYLDSRITDGYLYLFLNSSVEEVRERSNYKDYVPVLEEKVMEASDIYFPKEAQGCDYLVMTTVNLAQPDKFEDTKAIVGTSDKVYVTSDNIYILGNVYDCENEADGSYSDKTNIIRIAYENGIFHKEAEGSVKGILLDDMAINESNGYLRMAVTVNSCQKEKVTDDIFGYFMGYETTDVVMDNSIYVLDENLEIVGKIEGLAQDEKIYSARFMGDMGYFVTFRETDPLFSVDLSNPENPQILGELKISGFSEYLHFYSENLLLGIGMEADEDTGRTEGMKLSMFDISNPADVKEQDKYDLSEYDYADALYNYKAVMIDTNKNLFGFYAEDYNNNRADGDFLLFSYENGGFQQKMKIACENQKETYGCCNVRGTYIGDVFYLMYQDGRIKAYRLADGSMIEAINEKTE